MEQVCVVATTWKDVAEDSNSIHYGLQNRQN